MSDKPGPQDMMARLEEIQRQAETTLRRYEDLQQQLGDQQVEVFSEDGRIAVKLDKDGKVAEIRIDESAMRMRQTLSPTIVRLIGEAQTIHEEKSAELAKQFLGGDPNLAGWLDRIPGSQP
ncbi:YbaB/EbfC family nucleoid-associated protein [Glycomyces sp. NPDC046736]|uniref:YbaB/EbfC family nucleoid-associated protein n=1 Tax=Glycomyces sp. NPDC046736 TaxID=3155615 RepID=UPI0033DDA221